MLQDQILSEDYFRILQSVLSNEHIKSHPLLKNLDLTLWKSPLKIGLMVGNKSHEIDMKNSSI